MAKDKETKVRRIKATDDTQPKAKTVKKTPKIKKPVKHSNAPNWLKTIGKPFFAIGRYVRGSWEELRVTKWPNRRATWTLTLAVLVFSAIFAVLILLFDYGFDWLIKEIIL